MNTIHRWTRTAQAALAAALLTWGASAGAAPVSGTTGSTESARTTARPLAAIAREDFNFCGSVHQKTGWLIGLNMFDLATPSTEQSFVLNHAAAGAASTADIVSFLTYDNVLESATAHTGSLRWSMWAFAPNQLAGWPKVNGFRMGGFVPQILDGKGVARDHLYNLTKLTFRQRIATVNPPAGRYCIAFVVEMYRTDNECRAVSSDGFCPEAMYTLTPALSFR